MKRPIGILLALLVLAGCNTTEISDNIDLKSDEATEATEAAAPTRMSTLRSRLGYNITYNRDLLLCSASGESDSFVPTGNVAADLRSTEFTITLVASRTPDEVVEAVRSITGYKGTMEKSSVGNSDSALAFTKKDGDTTHYCYIAVHGKKSFFFEFVCPAAAEEVYTPAVLEMLSSVTFGD